MERLPHLRHEKHLQLPHPDTKVTLQLQHLKKERVELAHELLTRGLGERGYNEQLPVGGLGMKLEWEPAQQLRPPVFLCAHPEVYRAEQHPRLHGAPERSQLEQPEAGRPRDEASLVEARLEYVEYVEYA